MGINLIPFIDLDRLFKAMAQADANQENLTPEERNRNKRAGDVFVFFKNSGNPALKCTAL